MIQHAFKGLKTKKFSIACFTVRIIKETCLKLNISKT